MPARATEKSRNYRREKYINKMSIQNKRVASSGWKERGIFGTYGTTFNLSVRFRNKKEKGEEGKGKEKEKKEKKKKKKRKRKRKTTLASKQQSLATTTWTSSPSIMLLCIAEG